MSEKFLTEGGWASLKTQTTLIKPKIIKNAVEKINQIEKSFNKHLIKIGFPEMEFLKPVGSGTWYEKDIESNPDKVYGDIDYNIMYPVLKDEQKSERENELNTLKIYNAELLSFLKSEKFDFIDLEESEQASKPTSVKLILKVETEEGEGWVQIDFIPTHEKYKDWTVFRYTPVYGVKGFVLGNLYSTFGDMFDISIQGRGVRAKFTADDKIVSYAKRKDVEDRLVTSNPDKFMHEIARFVWEKSTDQPYKESDSLKKWKGLDKSNPTIEDLCAGIKAIADTLSQLDNFGTVIKYKSKKQFIDELIEAYTSKMQNTIDSKKFDKAESEQAINAAEKTKALAREYIEKVTDLLK
jgi:hypothetical protein